MMAFPCAQEHLYCQWYILPMLATLLIGYLLYIQAPLSSEERARIFLNILQAVCRPLTQAVSCLNMCVSHLLDSKS